MRERLRWWVVRQLDRLAGQCWTDLAIWAEYGDGRRLPWRPVRAACWDGDMCRCYCGKRGAPVEAGG